MDISRILFFTISGWLLLIVAAMVDRKGLLSKPDGGVHSLSLRSCDGAKEDGGILNSQIMKDQNKMVVAPPHFLQLRIKVTKRWEAEAEFSVIKL